MKVILNRFIGPADLAEEFLWLSARDKKAKGGSSIRVPHRAVLRDMHDGTQLISCPIVESKRFWTELSRGDNLRAI